MKKFAACILLFSLTSALALYAKAPLNPQARAAQQKNKQLRQTMRRNAKVQEKARKKAQKDAIRRARQQR